MDVDAVDSVLVYALFNMVGISRDVMKGEIGLHEEGPVLFHSSSSSSDRRRLLVHRSRPL